MLPAHSPIAAALGLLLLGASGCAAVPATHAQPAQAVHPAASAASGFAEAAGPSAPRVCTRSDLEPLLRADEVVVRRDVDDWFTVHATDVTVKREGESLTIAATRESKPPVYIMAPDPTSSRTFRSTGLGRSRLDRFLATTLDLASEALPLQREPAHHRASERVQIVIASASGKIALTATDASWSIATSECASTLPRAASAFQQEAFRTLVGPDILGSAPRTANQWQWVQPAD